MLFVVLLLIGSGWSFLKPFLSEWEKRILLGVFSLQLTSNISLIIIDQMAEGASTWLYWKSIMLWIDVISCFLVLPVIAWSIRNLKNSKDEKSVATSVRLNQFQQFYLIVIAYLYFSRVVVQFIRDGLPPSYGWIPEILRELSSLGVFLFSGFRFRPASPVKEEEEYKVVKTNSDDEDDDEDIQLIEENKV
jgi:G protein-coupled receptor 107